MMMQYEISINIGELCKIPSIMSNRLSPDSIWSFATDRLRKNKAVWWFIKILKRFWLIDCNMSVSNFRWIQTLRKSRIESAISSYVIFFLRSKVINHHESSVKSAELFSCFIERQLCAKKKFYSLSPKHHKNYLQTSCGLKRFIFISNWSTLE